jgi:hypothetical protein
MVKCYPDGLHPHPIPRGKGEAPPRDAGEQNRGTGPGPAPIRTLHGCCSFSECEAIVPLHDDYVTIEETLKEQAGDVRRRILCRHTCALASHELREPLIATQRLSASLKSPRRTTRRPWAGWSWCE